MLGVRTMPPVVCMQSALQLPRAELPSPQHLARLLWVCAGGFIKTIIRVLRCVGHYNSKLLVDKV